MAAAKADPRRALLARVHIARKEMRLEEEDYRNVLRRVTGADSAADASPAALASLLDEFKKLGWKPKSARRPHANPQVRMCYAIWKDIRPLLDGNAGVAELRGFVRRQTKDDLHPNGVDAPEFCSAQQLNKVIEGLKGWRERLRGGAR